MYILSLVLKLVCNLGSNGFIQLVNALYNNADLKLKELYLQGNQLDANQIAYLFTLLHLDINQSYYNQPPPKSEKEKPAFLFPSLRILDLSSLSSFHS